MCRHPTEQVLLKPVSGIEAVAPLSSLGSPSCREVPAVALGAAGSRRHSSWSGFIPQQSQLLADGEERRGRASPENHIQDGRERLLRWPWKQVEELDDSQGRVRTVYATADILTSCALEMFFSHESLSTVMCSEADCPAGKKPSSTGTVNPRAREGFTVLTYERNNTYCFVCVFGRQLRHRRKEWQRRSTCTLTWSSSPFGEFKAYMYVYFVCVFLYLGICAQYLYNHTWLAHYGYLFTFDSVLFLLQRRWQDQKQTSQISCFPVSLTSCFLSTFQAYAPILERCIFRRCALWENKKIAAYEVSLINNLYCHIYKINLKSTIFHKWVQLLRPRLTVWDYFYCMHHFCLVISTLTANINLSSRWRSADPGDF